MKKTIMRAKNYLASGFLLFAFVGMDFSWADQNPPLPAAMLAEKSPGSALGLSLLGAVVLPAGAFLAALSSSDDDVTTSLLLGSVGASVIGPSLGYFYGGLNRRGWAGVGIRMSLLIATIGVASTIEGEWGGLGVFLGGSGLVAAVGIIDAALVYPAVKTRNKKLREKTLAISPVFIPQTKAFGISVRVQF